MSLFRREFTGWRERVISRAAAPTAVDVGDINQDGMPDIVLVSHGTGREGYLEWFENTPSQFRHRLTFMFPEWITHRVDAIVELHSVELYDYDGDEDLDIFASADEGKLLAYWVNGGKGKFGPRNVIDRGKKFGRMVVCDLDGNGKTDVLTYSVSQENPRGQLARWEHTDGLWKKTVFSSAYPWLYWMEAVDLNQDGRLDLVTVSEGGGEVAYWENMGKKLKRHVLMRGLKTPRSITHGDFNGDGVIDLVVASYHDDITFILMQRQKAGKE